MFNESLFQLQRSYNNLKFGKFFFPKQIQKSLDDKEILSFESTWNICDFFLKKKYNIFQMLSAARQFRHSELFIAFKNLENDHLMDGGADSPYFQALVQHPHPDKLAHSYKALQKTQINDIDLINRAFLMKHPRPDEFVPLFSLLKEVGLLKSELIEPLSPLLLQQNNPFNLCYVLKKYKDAGLLEEGRALAIFEELLRYAPILVGDKATCDLWRGLSLHKLSLEKHRHWMMLIAEHIDEPDRGREVFISLLSDTIFYVPPVNVPSDNNELNGNQSTHTASIHATVSESAIKLWQRYGHQLLENSPFNDLSTWLNGCSDDENDQQIAAAKRCLRRLKSEEFTDPKSNLSLTTLLGLMWLAVHDDTHREGTLDAAKQLLIEAFYEIQRGYNITKDGDNGLDDLPICFAGTFNKILEKLWAIHTDIALIYMTKKGASMKFVSVINEEVIAYVNGLIHPSPEVLKAILSMHLTQTIKPIIFREIKANILERMFDEFGELWENNKASEEFHSFIDAGRYASLKNSSQKTIEQFLQCWQPELSYLQTSKQGFFFKELPPLSSKDSSALDPKEALIAKTTP